MQIKGGPIKADVSLRKRLVLGSVGLAIAVSAIFISVAYKLARDLGEEIELENTSKIAAQLLHQIPLTSPHSFNQSIHKY